MHTCGHAVQAITSLKRDEILVRLRNHSTQPSAKHTVNNIPCKPYLAKLMSMPEGRSLMKGEEPETRRFLV
jgi:hypothetical protein